MIKENKAESVLAPVVKTVEVALSVEEAFKLFTEEIGSWWPLDKGHSISGEAAKTCTLESHKGGRIFETHQNGEEFLWGTIQEFDPPNYFATTWHPGRGSEAATYYEVRFTSIETGTNVLLTHSGWEVYAEEAQKVREGYVTGWDFVLGKYIKDAHQ